MIQLLQNLEQFLQTDKCPQGINNTQQFSLLQATHSASLIKVL